MTQFQFDVICSLIQNGAPALAAELTAALSNVIVDVNKLVEENAKLKAELAQRDKDCEEKVCETTEG